MENFNSRTLKTVGLSVLLVLNFQFGFSQSLKSSSTEEDLEEIRQVLEDYKKSINLADTTLAKTFWLRNSEVSFIHPKGHEKGWEEIKIGIYGMFGSNFFQRDLKSYDESITLYSDMAILEFYWIFDAVFQGENRENLQTKGRESQVLKKIGNEWKLVHVHYSGMPVTGEREGF